MIKKGQLHRGAAPFRWRPSTSARETPPPNFGRAIGGEANCTSPTDLCRPTPRSKAQALERPPLPHSGRSSTSTLLATSYCSASSALRDTPSLSLSFASSGSEGHVSGCGPPPPSQLRRASSAKSRNTSVNDNSSSRSRSHPSPEGFIGPLLPFFLRATAI